MFLRHIVFTTRPPPYLLRCEPFFKRKHVCNSQENGVRTRCAAIVNHYALVNLLRRVSLLLRGIFSTAGSFGSRVYDKCSAFDQGLSGQEKSNHVINEMLPADDSEHALNSTTPIFATPLHPRRNHFAESCNDCEMQRP